MIKITEEIFLIPSEVVSVEREIVNKWVPDRPSSGHYEQDFYGSRITLKNGQKVFVRGMEPNEIIVKLGLSND